MADDSSSSANSEVGDDPNEDLRDFLTERRENNTKWDAIAIELGVCAKTLSRWRNRINFKILQH
jgi:hypothetical protein